MKPKNVKTKKEVSTILAMLTTLSAIVSNFSQEPGAVIRWTTIILAVVCIVWAVRSYPPHRFPNRMRQVYSRHNVLVWRLVSVVVLCFGTVLLLFLVASSTAERWGISLMPTRTPTATPTLTVTVTPLPTATPSDTRTPTPTFSPTLTPVPPPPPTEVATATITPTRIFHVVLEEDNLWCLAEKYYGASSGALFTYICRINQTSGQLGDDCSKLQVGEKIEIPTKRDFPWSQIPEPLPTPGVLNADYVCKNNKK